jgi:hypothetical protein
LARDELGIKDLEYISAGSLDSVEQLEQLFGDSFSSCDSGTNSSNASAEVNVTLHHRRRKRGRGERQKGKEFRKARREEQRKEGTRGSLFHSMSLLLSASSVNKKSPVSKCPATSHSGKVQCILVHPFRKGAVSSSPAVQKRVRQIRKGRWEKSSHSAKNEHGFLA